MLLIYGRFVFIYKKTPNNSVLKQCRRPESNRYGKLIPRDFKSRASAYSATPAYYLIKWDLQGSNLWPSACKADALPAELRSHDLLISLFICTLQAFYPEWTFGDSNPGPTGYEPVALTNWAKGP